jgi:hypothetical protein
MKSPTKKTNKPQSSSSYTSRGSRLRVISMTAAPNAATSAGGRPARNPAITSSTTTPCGNAHELRVHYDPSDLHVTSEGQPNDGDAVTADLTSSLLTRR